MSTFAPLKNKSEHANPLVTTHKAQLLLEHKRPRVEHWVRARWYALAAPAGTAGPGGAQIPAPLSPRPGEAHLELGRVQPRLIQEKLEVSNPGDALEQEADRVADQVMRMPEANADNDARTDKGRPTPGANLTAATSVLGAMPSMAKPLTPSSNLTSRRPARTAHLPAPTPVLPKLATTQEGLQRERLQREEETDEHEPEETLQRACASCVNTSENEETVLRRNVEDASGPHGRIAPRQWFDSLTPRRVDRESVSPGTVPNPVMSRSLALPAIPEPPRELLQRKQRSAAMALDNEVTSRVARMRESGGAPLEPSLRGLFERRFGVEFADVRLHTGTEAGAIAARLQASAFTIGRDIAFFPGQYHPESHAGKRLLAHELAHVVQQRGGESRLQRKLFIDVTKTFDPGEKELEEFARSTAKDSSLGADGVPIAKEIVSKMVRDPGTPHVFLSKDDLAKEIRIRLAVIARVKNFNGVSYIDPSGGTRANRSRPPDPALKQPYLNPEYWKQIGSGNDYRFKVKQPLPQGKKPSDAVEAIFAPGSRLECFSAMVAAEYYSLLKGLGAKEFNDRFPGGEGILITSRVEETTLLAGSGRTHKKVPLKEPRDLIPGDWVYFENLEDYPKSGFWRGENAIYIGGGKFVGLGTDVAEEGIAPAGPKGQAQIESILVKRYQEETKKEGSEAELFCRLHWQGRGLNLERQPVIRLDMSMIRPL